MVKLTRLQSVLAVLSPLIAVAVALSLTFGSAGPRPHAVPHTIVKTINEATEVSFTLPTGTAKVLMQQANTATTQAVACTFVPGGTGTGATTFVSDAIVIPGQ